MPPPNKTDLLQGTLDLIVLRSLLAGKMHGYGLALRIQQGSEDVLQVNQGSLYPALLRMEQRGWIQSEWGTSENNRRARFYSITPLGRKQMKQEIAEWERMTRAIGRLLNPIEETA